MEIKSILNDILKEVNESQDMSLIKKVFVERVDKSSIKKENKISMIRGMSNKNTYYKCIKYVYDCVLKYEGEGVINKSLSGGNIRWKVNVYFVKG